MENRIYCRLLALLLIATFITACGSTRIVSTDPTADIYMDSEYLGKGEASVTSIGPPNSATLEAKKNGKVVGSTTMSRSFTFGTFCWGVVSYYTGWYWGWYYPDNVTIPVYQGLPGGKASPWDSSNESIWTKPINKGK